MHINTYIHISLYIQVNSRLYSREVQGWRSLQQEVYASVALKTQLQNIRESSKSWHLETWSWGWVMAGVWYILWVRSELLQQNGL